MNRRVSLTALMGAVLLLGFALAALSHASPAWVAVMRIATAVALLTAPLAAIYRCGPARAGCAGFAVLGWGAVVLIADAQSGSPVGLGGLARPLVRSLPRAWIGAK